MKVETRSQAHASGGDQEGKIMTRKQKAAESQHSPSSKKPKNDQEGTTTTDGKSSSSSDGGGDFEKEYQEFGKAVRQHLSVDQMREILKINDQEYNSLVSDEAVVTTCVDLLFFGPPDKCAMCNTNLKFDGKQYKCYGFFSEWSSCTFKTRNPPRKQEETKLPDSVLKSPVDDLLKKHQDPKKRPSQQAPIKPLTGMVFALSGRFSRTHQYWKKEIERHGGKVSNSVKGITCLVVNASERERGGTAKIAEATEERLPMVREEWLIDSIEKQEPQPILDYDVSSDFVDIVEGKQTLMEKNAEAEVLEAVTGELKLYGKRAVYKDSNLRDQGGEIFEKDGIVYNCAFTLCDLGLGMNDYCIMQLIRVPEGNLHLYYKKSRLGSDKDKNAEERLEEKGNVDDAIKEFARMFEEITGNEFEPWEREKKIEKKRMSFFPVDMDIGVDARYGGLGHRQQGSAVMHCKLEPKVANFMKVLCSQGIYWYALKDMGINTPDMPTGMLTDVHLKRCEEVLLQFVQKVRSQKESGPKAEAVWSDFSQRWYNLLPCPRPSILRDYQELADHGVSAFESIRDINVASRLIGDMSGSTLDDPLSDCYAKLNCKISSLEKDSDDYKMIEKYFETTYEPIKIADLEFEGSIENIFAVESGASPSLDEMKNLPNKLLLWCGTRSSNLMRHLHQGFLPSACYLPVPGHMFGNAIVCSDAATEAARYAYSAVGRRAEGFLMLAVAALGDHIVETKKPPEESVLNSWQQKKIGAKGLGRKKTDESEHFLWGDNVKVPCGRLVASGHEDSLLEYNEYAVYDPKQTSVRFLVEVKFEEKGEVMQ